VVAVALAAVGTLGLCWGGAELLDLTRPGEVAPIVVAPPPAAVPMELPELEIPVVAAPVTPPTVETTVAPRPVVKQRSKWQRPARRAMLSKRTRT
jgi:hypothetical protein